MKILREALDLFWRSSPDVKSPITVQSGANESKKEKIDQVILDAGEKGQSIPHVFTK